jgi:hypothetical protein
MPPTKKNIKNTTEETDSKPKTYKKSESVKETKKDDPKPKYHQEKIVDESDDDNDYDDDGQQKKIKVIRKVSRTLLVSPKEGSSVNESTFKNWTGLTSTHTTKSNAIFLAFDTLDNAQDGFKKIRQDFADVRVKYSNYKVFFRISGLTKTTDYQAAKHDLSEEVTKKTGGNVLYLKFYRKDDDFIGTGDLTVDTIDSMNMMVSQDSPLNKFTIGALSGTFYRFKSDKSKYKDGDKIMSA